jgi:hypothetical protein
MSIPEFIDPNIAKNLEKELLNIIGTDIKTADTALYERKTLDFREIINNNFPTLLVVDYNSIKTELKQYQDIDIALRTYIDKNYTPTKADYDVKKFSEKEITLLISAITKGIKRFSSTSAKPVSYRLLQQKLSNILADDSINTSTTTSRVQKLFDTVYKLTDISSSNVEVFVFPKFASIGNLLRPNLEIGLTIAEQEAGVEIEGLDSIGKILAYGHTAAGYVDENGKAVLTFNSPKSLAIMFDILQASSDKSQVTQEAALKAVTSFVTDTRQAEVFIELDKDFTEGFLKLFVRAGGNIVKFENTLINSRRGSVLEKKEKRGVNTQVLKKLAAAFTRADTIISKRLSRYILNKKSSPNVIEYLTYSISSILKGEKNQKHTSRSRANTKDKDSVKKRIVVGITNNKVKLPKLNKPSTKVPTTLAKKSPIDLVTLINSRLRDTIKSNMGTGDSRDVLNYRTGRFAESVVVERISQSRQGMITAFYSYMKNPYAVFSSGGYQQFPRSRDPKLLIAKSIREIAQSIVSNQIRSVNV